MAKFISVIICLIMTLTLLASCDEPTPIPADTDEVTVKKREEPNTEHKDDSEPESTKESDTTSNTASDEPEAAYKWVIAPTDIEGDIQPVTNLMSCEIYPSSISLLITDESVSLIDTDGEIRAELPQGNYKHCGICHGITDHTYLVNTDTFEITKDLYGHGGGSYYPYIYDKDTGKLCTETFGVFESADDIDRAIVTIASKRNLTDEEIEMGLYSTDYAYNKTDNYGICIDGELVISGFEMYSSYTCGVVALCRDGKWGYYNAEGEEVLPCEYDASYITRYILNGEPINTPYNATQGILTLNKGGKWGFADIHGNMLTDLEFEEARPVFENKAWVKTSEGWGVIEFDFQYTEDIALNLQDDDSLYAIST